MRTIIELPDEQVQALAEICRRDKISRAEAIRRAIGEMTERRLKSKEARDAAITAAFGLWKDRNIDTDTYLEDLRSEWDR